MILLPPSPFIITPAVSVPPPSIILVTTAAVVMVSVATSAVMVAVAAPVFLLVIAVPAMAVLLVTAGTLLVVVALIPAATVHMGARLLIGGDVVLPRAPAARVSTDRRLSLQWFGEAAV